MPDFAIPLTIRGLRADDLPDLAWTGDAGHLKEVEKRLARVPFGETDVLVAFLPNGRSVGKVVITYVERPGCGLLTMFSVHEVIQSCGIGSALTAACEHRIAAKGLSTAEVDAETNNPRAQALYERLGYIPYDVQPDSWEQELPDGTRGLYETTCVRLRKELTP